MKHALCLGKYKHNTFSMIFILILNRLGDYRIGRASGCKCQVIVWWNRGDGGGRKRSFLPLYL